MVDPVVRLLVESVFLALPAVAIYLQIISQNRTKELADGTRINRAKEWPNFHLTRGSILFLTLSAISGLFHIGVTRSPVIISRYKFNLSILLDFLFTVQIIAILLALLLFMSGIFVTEPQLDESEQGLVEAIRVIF